MGGREEVDENLEAAADAGVHANEIADGVNEAGEI